MGDTPPTLVQSELARQESVSGPFTVAGSAYSDAPNSVEYSANALPAQYSYPESHHTFSAQVDMTQAQTMSPRPGVYNMTAMSNSLPQANYRQSQYSQGHQRYDQATLPSGVAAASQYGGQNSMGPAIANQQYYIPHHPSIASYYPAPLSPSQAQGVLQPRPGTSYYHGNLIMNPPPHPTPQYYYSQHAQYAGQPPPILQAPVIPTQYMTAGQAQGDPRLLHPQSGEQVQSGNPQFPLVQNINAVDNRQNVVRGPPRKPRQSGHAIWIGNLPPQTDLMNLVHHVCKEAVGLESLFLISKSNCAFANFKDEPSCVAAQQQLHDSKFQSVRLVSRLRKSTVESASGLAAPTGPAATSTTSTHHGQPKDGGEPEQDNGALEEGEPKPIVQTSSIEKQQTAPLVEEVPTQKDKFFVLKSLTVEDLELSVRTGIWATQSHNEETLNTAFEVADNVYLVFSANKSGEYFGYARMSTPMNKDPAAAIEFAPTAQSAANPDLPKAIPTDATEHAPRGRIIDDSARGTIFWEAERDDIASDGGGGQDEEASSGGGSVTGDANSAKSVNEGIGGEAKAWGKPFKLEWLSTTRLPFYRTRGLRNPWNSNREVKIARDGTELEPSVGRRLIGLFHRDLSQAAALAPGGPGGVGLGGMPMATGFPPMRQPFRQP